MKAESPVVSRLPFPSESKRQFFLVWYESCSTSGTKRASLSATAPLRMLHNDHIPTDCFVVSWLIS